MFNTLLEAAGLDVEQVRLVRHQDSRADRDKTPYALWRDHSDQFLTYQSRQNVRTKSTLGKSFYWAVFVVTPTKETLFVGLYHVHGFAAGEPGVACVHIKGEIEGADYIVFDVTESDHLQEYKGKLVIEWGPGYLAWVQQAGKQNKQIVELRPEFKEPTYPGHLHFIKPLNEIEALPPTWKAALMQVRGIYVLTCSRTKECYVGSAAGEGGFFERWCQHARSGGDALRLRSRDPSDYQVSILQVVDSGLSMKEIVGLEHLWMRKLQTPEMGLNAHSSRPNEGLPTIMKLDQKA